MRLNNRRGFTLIEVIVVAGIIAILAGILVPIIFKEIDESRVTRASADIRSISSGFIVFKKDTAQWPSMDGACGANVTLLVGDGNGLSNLAGMGFDAGVTSSYNDHLSVNATGCYSNWKGPYIARVAADPWGNTYVTNADGFAIDGRPVWIISAGPNGLLDTPSFNETILGDDIGLRMK